MKMILMMVIPREFSEERRRKKKKKREKKKKKRGGSGANNKITLLQYSCDIPSLISNLILICFRPNTEREKRVHQAHIHYDRFTHTTIRLRRVFLAI